MSTNTPTLTAPTNATSSNLKSLGALAMTAFGIKKLIDVATSSFSNGNNNDPGATASNGLMSLVLGKPADQFLKDHLLGAMSPNMRKIVEPLIK